jgi:hypothetical protein
MKQEMGNGSTIETLASPKKKCYQSPVLQVFGRVHLVTQGTGGNGEDGGGAMTMKSDRLTKEHIVRVGDHPLGIGVYLFRYKPEFREAWGRGRQFVVMADEVEKVMPEAVSVHPDGYKMVNYAMLGITRTLQ